MHLHTDSPFRIILSAFLAAFCCAISSWAATIMPNGAALGDMCDNSLACSVIDETWPKNKTFSCASKSITPTALGTATQALTIGKPRKIENGTSWPASASSGCANNGSDYSKHSYSNGLWTMYYTIRTVCKCKGKTRDAMAMPMCRAATSQDVSACNLAIFKFCSVEMNGSPCT
ncbi:uncharacterized protein PGTG_17910 [Puccinia graminis f. sp. tritici CRL 75-36-700-3]|uniref:Secreted protein n=1 Tax=Puccinia graminis f. sp. tritici (strain CRL 75-36-700-3 / race SCCL) TaxID=418459 RepID=E3L6K5_PUCGT|nr:uncharacterized protein PGTG_17910 [Puccinia graminis f. sp. tritici CRL 75-36-700-3]EFP92180.1 hypothetical protein PGTG_17910 [Puccinia graminis f. sp. tritici CRL 75-36-700-3]